MSPDILKVAGCFFSTSQWEPMNYTKPALTITDQIKRLQNRGLAIPDQAAAEFHLSHKNYYRLRAYWLPFEVNLTTHQFHPGATFDDVINLYHFDEQLRHLILAALETIEISFRSQWAYHFAMSHGPFAYLDPTHSKKAKWLSGNKISLKREIDRSNEVFIQHFQTKYTSEQYPPIWMTCELLSFGLLSRWIKDLRPTAVQKDIAQNYQLPSPIIPSLLQHLVYIRNICAHHGRLWNKQMVVTTKLPRKKPAGLKQNFNLTQHKKLYNTLVLILYLLNTIDPSNTFKSQLNQLIAHHQINTSAMGFPMNWQQLPIWK